MSKLHLNNSCNKHLNDGHSMIILLTQRPNPNFKLIFNIFIFNDTFHFLSQLGDQLIDLNAELLGDVDPIWPYAVVNCELLWIA